MGPNMLMSQIHIEVWVLVSAMSSMDSVSLFLFASKVVMILVGDCFVLHYYGL